MELFWKLTWISVFGFGFIVGFYISLILGDEFIKLLYGCEKNYAEYLKLSDLVNQTESVNISPERIAVYEKGQDLLKNGCIIK